ncbi:alpha-N-acetylglucosaminidase TIM-barrel domain-containing protein [Kribbella sp. NPDC004875]|uniref:alpha-N-acetylglucosaminidase TIM-barrel domain-containing protein n=1 Tax=Kribbella sp. NPDC004875 TaxID=3364107 RepID=UPI0036B804E7
MRRSARASFVLLCSALVSLLMVPATGAVAVPAPPGAGTPDCRASARSTQAQQALLSRVAGTVASHQVCFEIKPSTDGAERFTISGRTGHVTISATTASAANQGAGWYLKYVVHAAANLGNPHPVVPTPMPAPSEPITQTANAANRYLGNDTHDGYTDPYMGWDQWQSMLDIYALHGINQVYVLPGTDAVYQRVLQDFGYTAEQTRAWIPLPTTQPWWAMQNVSNYGAPISQELLDQRASLGRRIADRARELGMVPVLPGFIGTVPTDFAAHAPVGTKVIAQGTWSGQPRPAWLAPTDPFFAQVAASYYRHADDLLGKTSIYRMNPLQEGGSSGGIAQQDITASIMSALQDNEAGATWMQLGWQGNPTTAQLAGISDKSRFVVSDGLSDASPSWGREAAWPNTKYLFGSIYAYGGHTVMGATGQLWIDRYYGQLNAAGNNMTGIAVMPEGFEDPAAFELLSELPWHAEAFSLSEWMQDFAYGRYGTTAAAKAWEIIGATAYTLPRPSSGTHAEPAETLFVAQPNLTAMNADPASPKQQPYDTARFATALPQLLLAAPTVVQKGAYDFDLADVAANITGNTTRTLLPKINTAYLTKDSAAFQALTARWLELMDLTDDVMATVPWFMMGSYVASATSAAGSDPTARSQLATSLLYLWTSWVDPADGYKAGSLNNYANHTYSGLLSGYYKPNWQAYFDTLTRALRDGTAPAPIDWIARASTFVTSAPTFATAPAGDTVSAATAIADALSLSPLVVTNPGPNGWLPTSPGVIEGLGVPGGAVTVTENAASVCSATVRPDHTWSCSPATLPDGLHDIVVKESSYTTTVRFVIGLTLVDHWLMDTDGTVTDAARGGYNGTVLGDATVAPGKVGGALRFTGGTGTVTTAAPDLPAPWSVGAWVNITGGSSSMALLNSDTSIVKINSSSGKVGVTRRNVADYTVNYVVPKSTWTYLTYVDDGSRITVYANGSVVGTMNTSTPLGRAAIGSFPPKDSTTGSVDEVSIFAGALTAGQVQNLYTSATTGGINPGT